MQFGLLGLSFWGLAGATVILTQITIASVTIYLHRHQAHRALDLHPIISHFFRFWLWLTTGMVTSEWVAIHRKHHASTDVEGDPHSPVVLGLKKVLWEGAELYREAAGDTEMVKKYAHGTPNDWIEKNLYSKYQTLGIILMAAIDLCLFGLPGISIWAIQMLWIPFWAAGIINGVGHAIGYRNFECAEAARNIVPFGFWIGGEELHNNHHAFAASAKFSNKWWEFDLGWFYIRCLSFLKLATVRKLPPELAMDIEKSSIDMDTVRAVINNRLQVISQYYQLVIRPVLRQEQRFFVKNKEDERLLGSAGRLLKRHQALLSKRAGAKLHILLERFERLRLVYEYQQSLQNVWLKAAKTQKELLDALTEWCRQAEASGVEALTQFAKQVRCYVPQTAHQ